jgi:hypothetical protein
MRARLRAGPAPAPAATGSAPRRLSQPGAGPSEEPARRTAVDAAARASAASRSGHEFARVAVLPPAEARAAERRAAEETQPPGDDDEVLTADESGGGRADAITAITLDLPRTLDRRLSPEGVRTVLRPGAQPLTYLRPPSAGRGPEAVAHAIVAPGGAPTVVSPGAGNDCTPSVAGTVLSWNVVDADATNWGVDVTSLTLAGTIHIKPWPSDPTHEVVPNTANPVDGGNINNTAGSSNHWQAAIDDMADYDTATGGAGPNWHSTAASIAHETAHWTGDYVGDAVTSAAGGNWAGANADLDALREPKANSATSADARTALQPRVAARLATWRTAAVGRWNTLITTTDSPGSGGRGYAAGAGVLGTLIAAVRTYAIIKGWTGPPPAPGPAPGPAPAPPAPAPAPGP